MNNVTHLLQQNTSSSKKAFEVRMNCRQVRLLIAACALWMTAGVTNSVFAAADGSGDPRVLLPPVIPPSKLIYLDSPVRIPGEYMITFKGDADLAKDLPSTLLKSLAVAPGILPNTPTSITALANAMSAWYQQKEKTPNTILGIWTLGGLRGFAVRGISDSNIAELAQDPRIMFIEPNMRGVSANTDGLGGRGVSRDN